MFDSSNELFRKLIANRLGWDTAEQMIVEVTDTHLKEAINWICEFYQVDPIFKPRRKNLMFLKEFDESKKYRYNKYLELAYTAIVGEKDSEEKMEALDGILDEINNHFAKSVHGKEVTEIKDERGFIEVGDNIHYIVLPEWCEEI